MANIKFSQFTVGNTESDIDFVVGYKGANNIQISPANLLSATLTGYLPLTGGTMSGNIVFTDNVQARFGTGNDLRIFHDGSGSKVENYTGNVTIQQRADDSDIVFQCDDGSGGITDYFRLDGSNPTVVFSKSSIHTDNIAAYFGTGLDFQIVHNATNTEVVNATGNLNIKNSATNGDISFFADDGGGSGGTTTYFKIDGSARDVVFSKDIYLNDDVRVRAGTGGDFSFFHNGSNSKINNNTGNIEIENFQDDGDIIFKTDDGSGGTTEYFRLDGGVSYTVVSKAFRFLDTVNLQLGDGADFTMQHNGTSTVFQNFTGDLKIVNSADDKDIIFQSDDGSGGVTSYFELDGSAAVTKFRRNLYLLDNVGLKIGNSFDLDIKHDGSSSYIANANGHLYIKNSADDKDIIFQSDDGSGGVTTYFWLDGVNKRVKAKEVLTIQNSSSLRIGDSEHGQLYVESGNTVLKQVNSGNLSIRNEADDSDIVFSCDDGSGGVAEYMRLDGSQVTIRMKRQVKWDDNIKATFGDSDDLQIYHTGSSSIIGEFGPGNLSVRGDNLQLHRADGSQRYFQGITGGAATMYYAGDPKLTTTTDGANILGGTGVDTLSRLRVGGEGTGNNKSILELVEHIQGTDMHYGFSFTADGDGSNNLLIRRHNNNTTGATVITINRSDDNVRFAGNLKIQGVSEYTDNTAAIAAGLTAGDLYRTGDLLKIVH